jgi:hypothetical protein
VNRCLPAVLCLGLLLESRPPPAVAQDLLPGRPREARLACASDYLRFCRDVPPGGGRIILCMHLNADKLSPRCFQALTAWGLTAANAFKACLPDAQRYCSHVPPGMGRGLACILQNADRLSRPCRDALNGQDFLEPPPGPRNGAK